MSTSNILIKKAFAENAGSQYRFEITDTNETDSVSKATFDKGFPPASMLPEQAGGEPPHGEDFNGILYLITKNQQHAQAGNLPRYDASFATAIGGYNINSEVSDLSGNKYRSLVDNNTAELTDTASWAKIDYLDKTNGGTVPGNTNFTGLLQKNGSDVTALSDFLISSTINGYIKIPSGDPNKPFIFQWLVADIQGGKIVTYPISFPNNLFACLAITSDANGSFVSKNTSLVSDVKKQMYLAGYASRGNISSGTPLEAHVIAIGN